MSSKTKATAMQEEVRPALVPTLRFPEFREAGNWSAIPVGNISDTVIAGGTPSTSEKGFWGGEIRWMNSGELNDKRVSEVQGRITREGLENSNTKLIPPRCVLIGLAGQGKTRGTVAMNLVELCTNQSIAAIFPNESVFSSDFLYHDLDNRYGELRRLSAGGEGRGGLNLQIIKSLKVAIPSLPEQQKIAECLSSLEDLIAAQARKLDAINTHKQGLMQQLFPREGETQPSLRFPEFRNAKEWEEKRLEDLAKRGSGHTPSKSHPEYYNGGIKWVSLADSKRLDCGLISETAIEISEKGIQNSSAVLHPTGTVIVTRDAGIGKSAVMKLPMAVSQHFIAWVCKPRVLSNWFLYHLLQNSKPLLERAATGSTIKTIGLQYFIDLALRVPSLPEQKHIADCLTTLDELIAAENQKLEAMKSHKKGLMQLLFPKLDDSQ